MMDYFQRQIQLWGEERQETLKSKTIAIVGAGGWSLRFEQWLEKSKVGISL